MSKEDKEDLLALIIGWIIIICIIYDIYKNEK
jgi:hypothetical protein